MTTHFVIIMLLLAVSALMAAVVVRYRERILKATSHTERHRKIIRELSIINELSAALLSTLELDDIIDLLLDRSKELLKADRSAVVLLDGMGNVRNFYSSLGPAAQCKFRLAGILERVYLDMIPVRSDDIRTLNEFRGFPESHPDIRNIIVVPIILRGDVIGELIVTDRTGGEQFTPDDEDLLLTIAFYSAFAFEKALLHSEILKMAHTDGLTGLVNYRAFQERMRMENERAKRFGRPFSLLMLDIDRFKQFNDAHGHQTGDEALKMIAKIMSENIRGIDMAARYGGEEFAIILTETPLGGAIMTAERIRENVEKTNIRLNGGELSITISIGISTFPEDGHTSESLIDAADKALFFSKRAGRNMVSSFRAADVSGK